MLKFNPSNYLTFTPNSQGKLQTSFNISNPSSNCSAPFKIKSTKPELFNVRPHIGVINPLQQVQITIVTEHTNSFTFAKEIAHQHKFKVQYSMLDRAPSSINEALQKITDQNKQVHKFYLNTLTPNGQKQHQEYLDAKSNLSNKYKQMREQNEQNGLQRYVLQHGNYDEMSNQQKLQYLKQEIDKSEKEKSEVIMTSKPSKKHINIIILVLVAIFMIVVGNVTGKLVGLGPTPARSNRQKQKQYKYFGLEKLWAKEQAQPQPKAWWKFWN